MIFGRLEVNITPEEIQRLKGMGFKAVVVQRTPGMGHEAGQVVSKHRTIVAAKRRKDAFQRVIVLYRKKSVTTP